MISSCGSESSASVGPSCKGTGVFIRSLVVDDTSAEPPVRGSESKPVATPPVARPSCYISESYAHSSSGGSAPGLATGSQHPGTHSKPACELTGWTAANRSPEFADISNLSSSSPAMSYMPAERRNGSKLELVWNSSRQHEPSARRFQQDSCLILSRGYSSTGDAEIDEYGMKLCAAASTDSGLSESDNLSADGYTEQQRSDAIAPSSSNMKAMARAHSLSASSSFRAAAPPPPPPPPPPPLGCAANSFDHGINTMQQYHSDAEAVTSPCSLAAATAAAATSFATPFQLQCGVINHHHHHHHQQQQQQRPWPQPLPSQPINIQQHQHQFHSCQLQSDISSELQQAAAVSIPSNSNINSVHISLRPQLQQQQQNQSNSLLLEECAMLLQKLQLQELQAAVTAAATVSGCGSCGGSPVSSFQLPAVALGSHHCTLDGLTDGLTVHLQQQQQQLLALLSSTPAYSTAFDGTIAEAAAAAPLIPSTAPEAASTATAPLQAQIPARRDRMRRMRCSSC